ncbi:hypothetical protein [Amycolatopsis sp. NPDC051061]|uniref:hypothetical protein n=1 Tax=Amycolatopsis sp. NPDC051061 TaxID=3155042 RepID=UPI003418D397
MTGDDQPGARLALHLTLLFCLGCCAYGVSALALLVFDGRCVTRGPNIHGCWAVRLHLDQFLPVYGTAIALLIGLTAGPAQIYRRRPVVPVIRLAWQIFGFAFALSLVLR